ncbi:MAG: hypothetical protein OXN17_03550 [Candidatus Poribacteria bacterium]|nr:hypothetical protein [Candidatus Poribacteria bacterium]MDE0504912.1 hypothetical protein [Candidatus Poribacteria bacterium]
MNGIRLGLLLAAFTIFVSGCGTSDDDMGGGVNGDTGSGVSFQSEVLPILTQRCALSGCHVAGGPRGIDLRTYESVLQGGQRGAIVVAGNAAGSELVNQIVTGNMPPGGPPLDDAQVQLISDWINDGAENN